MEPATISVGDMEPQFTNAPTYMHASRRASCSKHEIHKAESALHGKFCSSITGLMRTR